MQHDKQRGFKAAKLRNPGTGAKEAVAGVYLRFVVWCVLSVFCVFFGFCVERCMGGWGVSKGDCGVSSFFFVCCFFCGASHFYSCA